MLAPIFTMRDININSNLDPLTQFGSSSRNTMFKDVKNTTFKDPMEYLSDDHEEKPKQHENSHKSHDERSIPFGFEECQWKLSQQNDKNFPIEGKALQNKY